MLKRFGLTAVLALAFYGQSSWARPTYNYFGLGYARQHIDADDSCLQDGVTVEGSLTANEHVFYGFRHVDVTSDDWCGATTFRLNGGFKGDVARNSSLYAKASIIAHDTPVEFDMGVGLETGLRALIQSDLETRLFLGYEIIDDFDETYVGAGLNYFFARRWSLIADFAVTTEDRTEIVLGVRFNL